MVTAKYDPFNGAIPDIGLHCPHCDYSLTGLTVRYCPECGEPFVLSDLLPEVLEESVAARRWQLDRMVADSGIDAPPELLDWLAEEDHLTPSTAMGVVRQLHRDEAAELSIEHARQWLERDPDAELYDWSNLPAPRYTGAELPIPDFGLACAECGCPLAGWTRFECPDCATPVDLPAMLPDKPMICVYRAPQWDQGRMVKLILDTNNVPCRLANDALAHAYGEIPMLTGYNEVLVPRSHYFDALYTLRHDWPEGPAVSADEWSCPECGERCPGTFELCWNCSAERQSPDQDHHANRR